MSLEQKIDALTTAVEAWAAALTQQNEIATKALGAKGGTATTTPTKKAPAKPKAPTAEDVRGLFGPYLSCGPDKATKKRLIETTKPLLEHFGVAKITDVDEGRREEALKLGRLLVDAYEAGGIDDAEDVRFPFMDDGGLGGDEEDGVL